MLNSLGFKLSRGQIARAMEAGAAPAVIEIPAPDGDGGTVTLGIQIGHLAVHRHLSGRRKWAICHLPTGQSFASRASGYFAELHEATEALVEISKLRDWATLPESSDLSDLYDQIWEIQFRCGGEQ